MKAIQALTGNAPEIRFHVSLVEAGTPVEGETRMVETSKICESHCIEYTKAGLKVGFASFLDKA